MKYKRIVISRKGGPEVLQVIEEELAEPVAGEVWVKIFASRVSFADVMSRKGRCPTAVCGQRKWDNVGHWLTGLFLSVLQAP